MQILQSEIKQIALVERCVNRWRRSQDSSKKKLEKFDDVDERTSNREKAKVKLGLWVFVAVCDNVPNIRIRAPTMSVNKLYKVTAKISPNNSNRRLENLHVFILKPGI